MLFDIHGEFAIQGEGRGGSDRSGHIRASREVLAVVVHRPEDLRALCDIGFPQRPFWMAPGLAADECAFGPGRPLVDLDDEVVVIEEEFRNILLFGDLRDGLYGTYYSRPRRA